MSAKKLPSLAELQAARTGWRYRRLSDHPDFRPVDPDFVKFVQQRLANGSVPSSVLSSDARAVVEERLAAATKYLPPQATVTPFGLGVVQTPLIGSLVLPEWQSNKRKAAIPVFNADKFAVNDKKLSTGAEPDEVDTSIDWLEVSVEAYGGKTYVDDDERDEAAGNLPPGVSVEGVKLDRLVTAYDTLKEKHQATFVRTVGNYATAPGNFYEVCAGASQWSHLDADPLAQWIKATRWIEKYGLGVADRGWLSADSFMALRTNKQIIETVKYTGTRDLPGNMVPVETLVALLGVDLVIARALAADYPGATPSELWGQDAGLVATGQGRTVARRFGVTATHVKYPYEAIERDGDRGGRGSDRLRHSDAWGVKGLNNNCGWLWQNAAASI